MQSFEFHRSKLNLFDDQHINMVYDQEIYLPFLNRPFSLENVEKQLKEKAQSFSGDRDELANEISRQYDGIEISAGTAQNIEALKDSKTFTITTGHQLSLFTGPLFFVIKILEVVKICEELNKKYPENRFVPVYWMASEDHDFEEIQSVNIFNKTMTWESDQKGPVGRFALNGFEEFRSNLEELFNSDNPTEIDNILTSYKGENLAKATRSLVNAIFADYGLVIFDGDNSTCKKMFAPIVKNELENQFSVECVEKANEELQRAGGKLQVTARPINLFYILDGVRSRIKLEGEKYIIDEVGEFTKEELLGELDQHPERFSPNVILRPLYQEMILPNLAYVGGAGEISYWLQLKGVFDAVGCTYPMIKVRNSVAWIESAVSKKIAKLDLKLEDLFKPLDALKKEYLLENSDDLDFQKMDSLLLELSSSIEESVLNVDEGMKGFAEAEKRKLEKQIEGIQAKLVKRSKAMFDQDMKALEQIKGRVFPNDKLQERQTNFFSLSPDGNYKLRMETLYNALQPEGKDFILIREI